MASKKPVAALTLLSSELCELSLRLTRAPLNLTGLSMGVTGLSLGLATLTPEVSMIDLKGTGLSIETTESPSDDLAIPESSTEPSY